MFLGFNPVLLDLRCHLGQQGLSFLLGFELDLILPLGLAILHGFHLGVKSQCHFNLFGLHSLLGLLDLGINRRLGLGGHLGLVVEQLMLGILGPLSLPVLKSRLSSLGCEFLGLGHLLGDSLTGLGHYPALLCKTDLSMVLNFTRMRVSLLSKCRLSVASESLERLLGMAELGTKVIFSWARVHDRHGDRSGNWPKGPGHRGRSSNRRCPGGCGEWRHWHSQ